MLAIEVNHKWDACPSKESTQAPVHRHIKSSKQRMRIEWTWWKWLDEIPVCPQERLHHYKYLFRPVLWTQKDWAILLHFIYRYGYLLVTNYLAIKLSVTAYFSACRNYLTENRLSFPSAPHWVRHSYLSKGLDRPPILVGHQDSFLAPLPGSEAPLVGGIW